MRRIVNWLIVEQKRRAKHHTENQYSNAKKTKIASTSPISTTSEIIPKEVPYASGTKIFQDNTTNALEIDSNILIKFAILEEIVHTLQVVARNARLTARLL